MTKYKVGDRLFYFNRFKEFMPCTVTLVHAYPPDLAKMFGSIYQVEVYYKDGDSKTVNVNEAELHEAALVETLYG